jgi:phosphate transport system permease protein
MLSALLLGFGRVIGETMIVLLVSGNRIALPGPEAHVNGWFAPVHTMTGIIAQEMGEVVQGSLHYRALFMVGIVLFLLSLAINFGAQWVLRRFNRMAG